MKIKLKAQAKSGDMIIPPGEYMVSLASETRQINLSGHGSDYKIPAIRRPNKGKQKRTEISFYPSGGPNWSILVKTPGNGEWIAQIRYSS